MPSTFWNLDREMFIDFIENINYIIFETDKSFEYKTVAANLATGLRTLHNGINLIEIYIPGDIWSNHFSKCFADSI